MKINTEFGQIVRTRRKELNMTQESLAEECKLSTRHISDIENGRVNPKFDTIVKICDVCEIDIGELPRVEVENEENTYDTQIQTYRVTAFP